MSTAALFDGSLSNRRLSDIQPQLEHLLTRGDLLPPKFSASATKCETVMVSMRDGVRLATDVYLPPLQPAPVIAVRTPYARDMDGYVGSFLSLARRGYVVVSQDCRGTGDSEPDGWDFYMFESEDGYDCVDWISKQSWYGGFIGSLGGSYVGQTQWCMALHPSMSTIVPQVSGLGIASNTTHLYMFVNAYARTVGKGEDKVAIPYYEMERLMVDETMNGGYFNEALHAPFPEALLTRFPGLRERPPEKAKRWLWEHYCALSSAQRAGFVKQALSVKHITTVDLESLTAIFGQQISQDAHTIPHASPPDLCRSIHAAPLILTGWYDWCLNDALATWELFRRGARPEVAQSARMIIGPHAHNMPGYREGAQTHPELLRLPSVQSYLALLIRWFEVTREKQTDSWPTVIYYLMGANEWSVASDWPPREAKRLALYLGEGGELTASPPHHAVSSDRYCYDPADATPTVGGSIVSYVYQPGSVDVSEVQQRSDVLAYTTEILLRDLDVVGPLRMTLYASSSARDTDFSVRLSDVFPDGRAIQLQSGILRARYRNADGDPEWLDPGKLYCLEIDMWATACRFKAGHRLRLDICSADFPRFDRNSNRGGEPGPPIRAEQTIYHGLKHPSHLTLSVLGVADIA